MKNFLGCLHFLEHHGLLCAFEADIPVWRELTCHHPCLFSRRCKTLTFESPWTPMHHGSPGILCSRGITNTMNGQQEQHTAGQTRPRLLMCALHCPIGLHIQTTSSKIKLLHISVCQQQSTKPNGGPFRAQGPVQLDRLLVREASLVRNTTSQVEHAFPVHRWDCWNVHPEKTVCPRVPSLRPGWNSDAARARPGCLWGQVANGLTTRWEVRH